MLGRRFTIRFWVTTLGAGAFAALADSVSSADSQPDCSKFFSPEATPYEGRLSRQGVLCVKGEKVEPDESAQAGVKSQDEEELDIKLLPVPAAGDHFCKPKVDEEVCVPAAKDNAVWGPPEW